MNPLGPHPVSARPGEGRDLRADFIRGLALLLILWNHVFWAIGAPMPFFTQFTPLHWGLATAAEAFVFLSGYVYGLVYARVARERGLPTVFGRSLSRAWHLYAANAVAMLLALGVIALWARTPGGVPADAASRLFLEPFLEPGPGIFLHLVLLSRIPFAFEVLALYVVLLILAPVYLALLRTRVAALVPIAAGLYLLAQFGVNLPSGRAGAESWYFNPLAWQALFLIGMVIGAKGWALPRHRPWIARVAAVVVGVVAIRIWLVPRLIWRMPELGTIAGGLLSHPVPLTELTPLEPIRIAYFLILALLVAWWFPRASPWWSSVAARPVVRLGQHSLEVFCFGLVYTYVAAALFASPDPGWVRGVVAGILGWLLSLLFARLVQARRSLQQRRPAVTPDAAG